jgi:hypothetical protein
MSPAIAWRVLLGGGGDPNAASPVRKVAA